MKTTFRIFLILTIMPLILFAQKNKTTETEVKEIIIDYNTKAPDDMKMLKNLKVNDWVSIKLINTPTDNIKNIKSTVLFTNRNLEQMDTFKSHLPSFDNTSETSNIKTITPQPITSERIKEKEAEEALEKSKNKLKEMETNLTKIQEISFFKKVDSAKSINEIKNIVKSSLPNVAEEILKTEKKYKIDEKNAGESLKIDDVKNFTEKHLKEHPKDQSAIKAKEDYEWQKKLIGYLQDNTKAKLERREKVIDSLSSINEKLKLIIPDTTSKYFPVTKIENYDNTEFNITIERTNSEVPEKIRLPFRNRNGFKLDFSTGFLASGLYEKQYSIRNSENAGFVQLKEDITNMNKFSLGITLLAHAYFRCSNFFNPAITSGLAYSLQNESLNYILGGSILLGEDQRFIVSTGLIVGKNKTLPEYYKINSDIPVSDLPITSQIPMVDKLKISWFIGITYNLGISGKQKVIDL